MSSNKFIISDVGTHGITVKFVPKITSVNEIEEFMRKELSGVNTWKCFGETLYFYIDRNLMTNDELEEEEFGSDDEDSDDE